MKGMKVNKSFAKRMKITKTGKVLTRKAGQNHFNSKAARVRQLKGKKHKEFAHILTHKELSALIPMN
ncbi:MAG: 50S ribosomal protein L35 [Candidatus Vogelbacteria bacterium]|nr:50S ribosomal protein L35 [Candidatus Vogelbacteria bacterium]